MAFPLPAPRSILTVIAILCLGSFSKKSKAMRFGLEVALFLSVVTVCRAQDELEYYEDEEEYFDYDEAFESVFEEDFDNYDHGASYQSKNFLLDVL